MPPGTVPAETAAGLPFRARRMRRAFGDLVRPCARTDADLSAVAQRLALEEKAEQRRYDTETNHGLLADHQAAWSRDVTRRLGGS